MRERKEGERGESEREKGRGERGEGEGERREGRERGTERVRERLHYDVWVHASPQSHTTSYIINQYNHHTGADSTFSPLKCASRTRSLTAKSYG